MRDLLLHWCWDHTQFSQRCIDLILKQLVQQLTTVADMGDYKGLFKCFIGLLQLNDSIPTQTARIDYGMTQLLSLLTKVVTRTKVGDEKLLMTAIPFIMKLAHTSKGVHQWMTRRQDSNYSQWLNDYKRVHQPASSSSNHHSNFSYTR